MHYIVFIYAMISLDVVQWAFGIECIPSNFFFNTVKKFRENNSFWVRACLFSENKNINTHFSMFNSVKFITFVRMVKIIFINVVEIRFRFFHRFALNSWLFKTQLPIPLGLNHIKLIHEKVKIQNYIGEIPLSWTC